MKNHAISHLPCTSGIYLLTHAVTGDTYVGSAKNIRLRFGGHLTELRQKSHGNPKMLALASEHGIDFACRVLEETGDDPRFPAERRWIDRLKPTLNLCAPPGSDRLYPSCGSSTPLVRMTFDMRTPMRARLKVCAALASQAEGKTVTMGQLLERWAGDGMESLEKKLSKRR